VTQPTFTPVPTSGEVRPTTPTPAPEFSRTKKAGLLRSPSQVRGTGHGTPAPGEGYAFTISEHEVAKLPFAHEHDRHDVAVGIALVAAKRASHVGRGPIKADVTAALQAFGLRSGEPVTHEFAFESMRRDDLYLADEAFLSGTAAEVVPIHSVDDRIVGSGTPGPITKSIQSTYAKAVRGELDQYKSWLTVC